MVERIERSGSLAREAILAALKQQTKQSAEVRELVAGISADVSGGAKTAAAEATPFAERLQEGLQAVDQEVRRVDELPADLLTGKIEDFHEVAVQIRRAEFTFRFAMEVRNKLIDAYREVMRMNV